MPGLNFPAGRIHPLAWVKYVFGDPQPLARSIGITDVTHTSAGRYVLTLPDGSDTNYDLTKDGIVVPQISGPHLIYAEFADQTHVEVQVRSISGGLVDPPAGTRVQVLIFN